jgi:hypothetical protein
MTNIRLGVSLDCGKNIKYVDIGYWDLYIADGNGEFHGISIDHEYTCGITIYDLDESDKKRLGKAKDINTEFRKILGFKD